MRRALPTPYRYGRNLSLARIRPGDVFEREGDAAVAHFSGTTITKVKRTTFDYDGVYMRGTPAEQVMHMNERLDMLIGARIIRGRTVHIVTE